MFKVPKRQRAPGSIFHSHSEPPTPCMWEKVTLQKLPIVCILFSPNFLVWTKTFSCLPYDISATVTPHPHSLQQFKYFRASLSFAPSTHLSIGTLLTHFHWLAASLSSFSFEMDNRLTDLPFYAPLHFALL